MGLEEPSLKMKPTVRKLDYTTNHSLVDEERKYIQEDEDFLKTDVDVNEKLWKADEKDSPNVPQKLTEEKVKQNDTFEEVDDIQHFATKGLSDDEPNIYQHDDSQRSKYGGYQSLVSPAEAFVIEANQFSKSLGSPILASELSTFENDYLDPDFLIHVYYVEQDAAIEILENILLVVSKLLRAQNQKNEENKFISNAGKKHTGMDKDEVFSSRNPTESQLKFSSKREQNQNLITRSQKLKQLDQDIANLTNKAFKIAKLVYNMEKLATESIKVQNLRR